MLVFDLKHWRDIEAFAKVISQFQAHCVEYGLSYEPSNNCAYVIPTGARK
jgi:hypothetical protein